MRTAAAPSSDAGANGANERPAASQSVKPSRTSSEARAPSTHGTSAARAARSGALPEAQTGQPTQVSASAMVSAATARGSAPVTGAGIGRVTRHPR